MYETFTMRKHTYISGEVFIAEEILEKNTQMPIDRLIEKTLEEHYAELEPEHKRICQCFFQRYQDKSYKVTNERIKRLEKKPN